MPKKQCIGKTFHVGGYLVTVEDVIAEGGFALVFLTRDQMGRRYALKRMYVNTEQDVLQCQQEIHILETLGKEPDSYIVRYFASTINVVDEEVKEVLILLEYYKYNVLQLMNERFQVKRYLTEEEVLNIFADICHAVGKLHTHRSAWIHRDLKVENILIDKDGHCVLCDFGSCTSRIFDPTKSVISDIEEDLKKYTTIAYRAPEMVNLYGIKKPITSKADIWALGVLLYKMCYFTLPFGESSLAIQNCNLLFPSGPSYSKHLTGLIRYCLKVNPDERPDIFQVSSLVCALVNRDCLVPNINRCPILSTDLLLTIPETSQAPAPVLDTSRPIPRSVPRPVAAQPPEFSSTTSILVRERPKASTPSGNLVLIPPMSIKTQPSEPSAKPSLLPRPNNTESHSGSPFKSVAGAVNPFRAASDAHGEALRPTSNNRMGHRRNTSDTSMVPTARPLSPTPTQNASEKSRSADTSPARSPHPGGEVEKKFSNWNPFDDAEVWNQAGPMHGSHLGGAVESLAHSLSSLVRGGSISSASRTTISSPTGENVDFIKGKSGRATAAKAGASDVKKEKKKFRYQKFDNDSEEELVPEDETDHVVIEAKPAVIKPRKSGDKTSADIGKDTDSIGSASDLKHEEDTTDDEHLADAGAAVQINIDQDKLEEVEDRAYDCSVVQYGTLEETASAIQSLVSHKSILQDLPETSSKPLLDNGFDKSDDDDLDRSQATQSASSSSAAPQRRLTFESMGLLSVFDQIPFRQPKKSKTFSSLSSKGSDEACARLTDEVAFPDTNPFSTSYSTSVNPSNGSSRDSGNILADRYASEIVPPKIPPPVPPKPTFLRKEVPNGSSNSFALHSRAGNIPSSLQHQHHPQSYNHHDAEFPVSSPSYDDCPADEFYDDALNESLVSSSSHNNMITISSDAGGKSGKKAASGKSSSSSDKNPIIHSNDTTFNHSTTQSGSSPKLPKSPSRRFRRAVHPEGISNISFEDA